MGRQESWAFEEAEKLWSSHSGESGYKLTGYLKDHLAPLCPFKTDGHKFMMVQSALWCVSPGAQIQKERKHIVSCPGVGFQPDGVWQKPNGTRELGYWQQYC